MSDEDILSAEDSAPTGKTIAKRDLSEVQAPEMPKKITKTWVRRQLPASVWRLKTSAKCNPEMIALMAETARTIPSKKTIAARAGLAEKTIYNWINLANQGVQPYVLWKICLDYSMSLMEEELLEDIRGHAMADWKAAAWYLARINRDEYGDDKRVQGSTTVTVNQGPTNKTTINTVTDDDARQIAQIMGQIGALPVIEGEVVEEGE